MPDMTVAVEWAGVGLQFQGGAVDGVQIKLDGNSKAGISPVQALLTSLAGCTAADVVDILTKMRVPFDGLRVRVEGDRMVDPPRRFHTIHLTFEATGLAAANEDKLRRAVELSQEKYCSVMHSLRSDIDFRTDVVLS